MSNESKTLRDLLAGVICGTTINTQTATATDLVRAVVDTTGAYLMVSGISGSGTTGASFTGGTVQDLNVAGTLSVNSSSGTSGWFPADELGNGVALAGGIVTSFSWPNGFKITEVSAAYTGLTTDEFIVCSGTSYELYLPSASGSGRKLYIKNYATGTITIYPLPGESIDYDVSNSLSSFAALSIVDSLTGVWSVV